MIKYYKLLVVSILLAFGFSEVVFSQCTSAGTQYPSVTFTPACTGAAETISTCVFAGEYSLINVVAGRIYTFATCGGASYDTQLTLFNNAGLGFLAYNDDGCGAQSTITWTATFTGVVRLKLNLYNCVTNSTCTSVFVTCTVPVGCTYTVPFTGSNTITTGSGTICDHAGTGNYSNSANGYTVINPVGACQSVRLTFTQFTTEGGYDYVTIFDGVGTGGTILYGPTSGSPGLPTITSISGPLTIRFTSDGSVVYAGFSANISNVAAPASTLGSVSNPGPINFCDPGGNFVTPVVVSGQTGTVTWDWGSNNGVWNNNWLTGTSSGTCCFPKKTSNSDGNADRIRYRVSNAGCAAVTSGTILIVNRWNEAPTALATSAANYCANAAPPTITLTATFPTSINKNGTVAFYSGSCGGTLVGSVTAPDNSTTASVTITAPTSTTNYFVRYEPGAGTGCSNTACATISVPVTALPAAPSPVNASPTTICVGSTSQLNATSAGNTIQWYTVPSGGASIGTSASGANFPVSPGATTTYYAEASTPSGGPGNQTFNFTGGVQTFTVPSGVTSITVDAYGAAGYGALGYGGRVQSTHPVVPGEVLQIYVGGAGTETTGGFNGGGDAGANIGYGSGGGATDIRQGGAGLGNRIMVAGGGGGTGSNCGTNTAEGGHGGGLIGMSGCVFSCSDCQYTGAGGTQVAGGTAGPTGHGSCTGNQNGSLGQGGSNTVAGYGTGGGGGYYGGGSGCFEGAGGGSSYTSPSASGVSHTQGARIGNGVVTLSWSGAGGCVSATRTPVTVTVNANPTAANAGPDQTICATSTNLAGNTPFVGTGTWSIIAGAGGSLGAPTSPSSSFTGVAGTSYTLRWTISNAPCTASIDDVVINIQSSSTAPTSISGVNAVCSGSSTTLTLVGGSPGAGATAQWFSGSCGGTSAGTGNSITVSPTSTTTYFVRYAGNCNTTGCASITVTVNTLSTPPTGVSGTTTICTGGSTTLSATGGSLGTGAVATWYGPSACGPFTQDWVTQPYGGSGTAVNSVVAGILNVTSTNGDPIIDMAGLGSFDPNIFRYVNIRYRVISGTPGTAEIFFYNGAHNFAVGGESATGNLIGGGAWQLLTIDMFADPQYTTGGNILGWRFDWSSNVGVNMEIDYISLTTQPIGSGTVAPTATTTYFVRYEGQCNTTPCASVVVNVSQTPTTPNAGPDQTVCANFRDLGCEYSRSRNRFLEHHQRRRRHGDDPNEPNFGLQRCSWNDLYPPLDNCECTLCGFDRRCGDYLTRQSHGCQCWSRPNRFARLL
jgi:hypothetical protein